jgi:SAM-dependent methyltransferase
MFFRRRSAQAEYFDLPGRSEAETLAAFRDLDQLNRQFRFAKPFEEILPKWLGIERCAQLEVLDLGAGTGSLGRKLSAWANERGWRWQFTNLDSNPLALRFGGEPRAIVGSVLALPFPDASFDLVVASQMTHHLTDDQIVRHLREAWRVTRDALFICDLHRNAGFYAVLRLLIPFMRIGRTVREDALLSVKRAFHLCEWLELANRANVPGAHVSLYYGTRIVLQARKGREEQPRRKLRKEEETQSVKAGETP